MVGSNAIRWIAVTALCALLVSILPVRGSAQTLQIPVDATIRPIQVPVLFQQFFNNFFPESDGTTYVQTGDIPAMWLRDSAAQSIPYIRFVAEFPGLKPTFYGVIQRDAKNILANPQAEAFSADYHVWEDKWEIDSLSWPIILTLSYYANTHDRSIFTPTLHQAMQTIVATFKCEQQHATCSHYRWPGSVPTHDAYNPSTGMIWSAFRPSDDPVTYRFNIPQEAMAVVAMHLLAVFARDAFDDDALANDATTIANQVSQGIERYGRTYDPKFGGWMYAYETDGNGHFNMMDDANIPNLTALPYINWCSQSDPTYVNTRRFTLSSADPYYYTGTYASGLGSPHTPKGWVWPLGIIGAALSTSDPQQVATAIDMLDRSDTLNGLMHESVDPNDPSQFTRPEFGWANAFWADLLFRAVAGYPPTPVPILRTIQPGEQLAPTPLIVTTPVAQSNAAAIEAALKELLAQHPHP